MLDCQNTFVLCVMLNAACIYKAKAILDFITQTRLCLWRAIQLNTEVLLFSQLLWTHSSM